jgi:acetyl-CoA C-acetyltransferase
MSEARIVGAGLPRFGKFPDRTVVDLAVEAITLALDSAGIMPGDIDAAFFGAAGGFGLGQRVMVALGRGAIPIVNTENACASSAAAFYLAQLGIRAGEFRRCLVVGAHSYSSSPSAGAGALASVEPDFATGLTLPGLYALIARRHMSEHGTTPRQLALVAVKNHGNGALNPQAHHRETLTVEEVLGSRMIADPLTLYQCCARTDGAAAVVLSGVAGDRGPKVRSCVLLSGTVGGSSTSKSWGVDLVSRTATTVWEQSSVAPSEVDVFEVHDAFTIGELVSYEALGLCGEGESGPMVERNETELGGGHPVNPSGGLLARGHPVAATGVAMLAEITLQLMDSAGPHQVPSPRLGVAETMGGGTSGISGNACVITLLERGTR